MKKMNLGKLQQWQVNKKVIKTVAELYISNGWKSHKYQINMVCYLENKGWSFLEAGIKRVAAFEFYWSGKWSIIWNRKDSYNTLGGWMWLTTHVKNWGSWQLFKLYAFLIFISGLIQLDTVFWIQLTIFINKWHISQHKTHIILKLFPGINCVVQVPTIKTSIIAHLTIFLAVL